MGLHQKDAASSTPASQGEGSVGGGLHWSCALQVDILQQQSQYQLPWHSQGFVSWQQLPQAAPPGLSLSGALPLPSPGNPEPQRPSESMPPALSVTTNNQLVSVSGFTPGEPRGRGRRALSPGGVHTTACPWAYPSAITGPH